MSANEIECVQIGKPSHNLVLTDGDGNILDYTLEHLVDDRYLIKFDATFPSEDLECTITLHEDV